MIKNATETHSVHSRRPFIIPNGSMMASKVDKEPQGVKKRPQENNKGHHHDLFGRFSVQESQRETQTSKSTNRQSEKYDFDVIPSSNQCRPEETDHFKKKKQRSNPITIKFQNSFAMEQEQIRVTLGKEIPMPRKPGNLDISMKESGFFKKQEFDSQIIDKDIELGLKSLASSYVKIEIDDNNELQTHRQFQQENFRQNSNKQKQKQRQMKLSFTAHQLQQKQSVTGIQPLTMVERSSVYSKKKQKSNNKVALKSVKSIPNLYSVSTTSQQSQKKITLRDYLNLTQLSAKSKKTNNLSSKNNISLSTLSSPKSGSSLNTTSKRRQQAPNSQIMAKIKKQIENSLLQIQQNLNAVTQICQQDPYEEPSQEEIMKAVALSRMLREKLVQGSDEVIKFMQSP